MSCDRNEVRIVGVLDETPRLRHTRSGTAVSNPTVVTERAWTDNTGEKRSSCAVADDFSEAALLGGSDFPF